MNSNNSENKEKRAIFRYFEIIFQKASKLILVNLAYFSCLIPLLCGALFVLCVIFDVSPKTVESFYFLNLAIWVVSKVPPSILLPLAFASLLAYGPLTAGFTYCIRCIATGKICWVSDMFSRAKSNWKQGVILGIIDIIIISSCALYLASSASLLQGASFAILRCAQIASVAITIVYFVVRFYSYTISVTFDLKIKDIFKNSLIFCVLGFFRNAIALVVCAFAIFIFISTPKVDIVLIATLVFSICRFTALFCTYPIIEEYMLSAQVNSTEKQDDKE